MRFEIEQLKTGQWMVSFANHTATDNDKFEAMEAALRSYLDDKVPQPIRSSLRIAITNVVTEAYRAGLEDAKK